MVLGESIFAMKVNRKINRGVKGKIMSDIRILFCTTDASGFRVNVDHLGWQVEQLVQHNMDLSVCSSFVCSTKSEYLYTLLCKKAKRIAQTFFSKRNRQKRLNEITAKILEDSSRG